MTLDIALTLGVILLTVFAFLKEWAAPDILALSILCLVVALGLVGMDEMVQVFRNEAPLTIAALFVIGGALEKSGAVDQIGNLMQKSMKGGVRSSILIFSVIAAFFSAWMNNTAIVAIFLPVVLGFARSKDIPASKLLIPLSYSSILGGCCTLIGTSTNLIVNGALAGLGLDTMSMFAMAPLGIPIAIAGISYITLFGPKLLPSRSSIIGSLEINHRITPLHHLLIGKDSTVIGLKLTETLLVNRELGIHILEIRRQGARLMTPLSDVVIEKNDRFLLAMHRRRGNSITIAEIFEKIGAQELSIVDGILSELVVPSESSLVGRTLSSMDFRQNYNCVALAVHRNGLNITSKISDTAVERGDTLLVITAVNNLPYLKASKDFILTDTPDQKTEEKVIKDLPKWPIALSWSILIGVVLIVSVTDFLGRLNVGIDAIPIHYASMVGALVLLWAKVITPRDAYQSIDWQVLLMLYGLLGLGMAMQSTGTAEWLAKQMVMGVDSFVSQNLRPYVLVWIIFTFTLLLTEVLSNNATALMMVPIVVQLAAELGVNYMPFVMCVTIGASAAFALPMGYQTHMMVYGPGGYRFSDYLRIGIPLNVLCVLIACPLIPWIWPF